MTETAKSYHHGNLAAAILERAAAIIDTQGIEALTLRGIARDLGVSHGAPNRHFLNKAELLSALATDGWTRALEATLGAAEATGSDNAHTRLHAMGCGFLRWALNNRALFRTLSHPDVNRYANDDLREAISSYSQAIKAEVAATQTEARHPSVPLEALNLFTNAVPMGVAVLLINQAEFAADHNDWEDPARTEDMIKQVIDLVVPPPASAAN
ncbi:MAG: TetR/AcrR family transcriptional regulator [Pseudomonadota bacterium]